ncbi:MAG: quinone-dependent dihydroorotate dehydrogenase, partial [Pseudomonadota bacterium]
ANLLHLITAMIFDGPQSMGEINRGIVKMLKKDGFKTLAEAVGSKNPLPAVPGYVAKQRARDAAQVIKVAAE